LSNAKKVSRKRILAQPEEFLTVRGASTHNLKDIDVKFPLHRFVSITGLSGSGKSTLLHDTLYQNLAKELGYTTDSAPVEISSIEVPEKVKRVTLVDQSPIGRTPRSNPATDTNVFDYIRQIVANTAEANVRGYKWGRFSFNVKG